jgi:hypothetical protein
MKKLLVCVMILASVSLGQITKQYIFKGTALGTSWLYCAKDTTKPYLKTTQVEVCNDDADADTIWVAFGTDTTSANIWPVLGGETRFWPSVYISGVRIKSSDSAPYRVVLH